MTFILVALEVADERHTFRSAGGVIANGALAS
jgi:hypothetical protein